MKKNLILLGILVALLIGTYFLQEKRTEQEYLRRETEGQLIKGEILRLALPHVKAEKREGQWWSGGELLSHNTFKQIERKLGEIKTFKDIAGNPGKFFRETVDIEVNGEPLRLGEMSLDKQGFYVARGNKIALAVIDGGSTGVTSDEDAVEELKLTELKNLLTKNLEALRETQLFRFYTKLPWEKVLVESDGNLPFELLLDQDGTVPAPIGGVSVHHGLKEKFLSVITQVMLKQEIPYSEKLKFKRLSSITFIAGGEKSLSWQVWLKGGDSADAVLIDEGNKRAFLMVGGSLKVFFIQLQDYWDKKVIPPAEFKSFDRLPVTFVQDRKEAVVTVMNREPLDFKALKAKVRPGNMQDLFQLIFNLGTKDQAGRVSQLTKSERQQFLDANPLKIELMGHELLCIRKKDELILVNLTRGFKSHFAAPFENLHCRFEDVLEL